MSVTPHDPRLAGSTDEAIDAFLLDRDHRRDPYPLFRRLHEQGPIHVRPDGTVFVSSFRLCREALTDPRLGKGPASPDLLAVRPDGQRRASLPDSVFTASLVHVNPPEHTRLREALAPLFTSRRVEGLRASIVAVTADRIEPLVGRNEPVDLLDALAFAVPVWVIGELVGVPEAERAGYGPPVRDQALMFEPGATDAEIERGMQAARSMTASLARVLRERRRAPVGDLLSELSCSDLSRSEQIGLAMLVMGAGFETTSMLIGNAVATLLAHPEQLAAMRQEPALISAAVEEVLRFESPVQIAARVALRATSLGGHTIEPGTWVACLLGAANRDPAVFTSPDVFDVRRNEGAPLSFSAGIHHCLGAPLARLEAAVVLEHLLGGRYDVTVTEDVMWRSQFTARRLDRLMVRIVEVP